MKYRRGGTPSPELNFPGNRAPLQGVTARQPAVLKDGLRGPPGVMSSNTAPPAGRGSWAGWRPLGRRYLGWELSERPLGIPLAASRRPVDAAGLPVRGL